MGLLRWLKSRQTTSSESALDQWRRDWHTACVTPDSGNAAALAARLERLQLPEEETEIEREMLDGLTELLRLQSDIATNGLPMLETGHRVVGTDRCHFSVTASMPDDGAQPTGRLIFTHARAIFAGGGKATTVPWHAVADVLQHDRDVLLVRHDRETFYR